MRLNAERWLVIPREEYRDDRGRRISPGIISRRRRARNPETCFFGILPFLLTPGIWAGFHYFVHMLKKLRSIFVIDEEKPTAQPSSGTVSGQSSGVSEYSQDSSDTDDHKTVKVEGGEVNEKFLNILLEAMEKHDLEGFDYMEFKRFLKSLNKVELDEATRYRSAFAAGQTMGATKEKLINSAKQYVDILKQEQSRFEQAAQNQRSKVVDERKTEIESMQKEISDKQQQIASLTQEIEKTKQDISKAKDEVTSAQEKIQQTQNEFQVTYQHVTGDLEADIRKMDQYLS